jgi:lysyl endopeptidase
MKRKLLSTGFFIMMLGLSGYSQTVNNQVFARNLELFKGTPVMTFPAPNMEAIRLEDEENDRNGELYRIGVYAYTNITTQNAGSWTTKPNGDRVWQLHVKFQGAEALSFLFSTFKVYDNTQVDVFNTNGGRLHKTMTSADVLEHFQQNIALCFGDEMTLQISEPAGSRASEIHIDRIVYNYRSTGNPNVAKINESESCEVNVNCSPVGTPWQDEKRGVARIYVVDTQGAGWCTGSLVNNTALDCKPLFLTALHCGVSTSASNSNQWRFYFRYEAPTCTNPGTAGTLDDNFITGCVRLANSNDNGGDSGSDFLLVQLGTLANQATTITTLKSASFNAYWNGWDANTTATTGGVGIHHPAGDIKKISTFNGTTSSTSWGSATGSHWQLSWSSNANGYGVTEGGSSGSPLFNSAGRVVGTLTGGSSFCNTPASPDFYGKMSFHWTANGAPANEQLKTYLDPGNTGQLVLDGSPDPCTVVTPTAPVANFLGNPLTLNVGGTVMFTDLTTNAPTSWSWSITPGTGWSYAGGTSASSQNPQVTFTAAGQYTISLTASNAAGSDVETKNNYITVTTATGPCTSTSTNCDEFIQNVTLQGINNTTTCTNYASYANTAVLTPGVGYTVTVVPQITGQGAGSAYTGDEIAVWIDWNDDMDFTDAGEQVGYAIASQSAFDTQFEFTAPASAMIGSQVAMRVRMSYQPDDGAITPCGTSQYGEVEDYLINIQATAGLEEAGIFADVSVFPNPASDKVSVDLSSVSAENVSVTLIDMTGKILTVQKNVAGTVASFDMSTRAKGMYQVRISDGSSVSTRKVTKL